MKSLKLLSVISFARVEYLESDNDCPEPSSTTKYIKALMMHDLLEVSEVNNIRNLKLHEYLTELNKYKTINVFYVLLNPYDPKKELLIMIPGGLGQSHTFIHRFQDKL